MCRAWIALLVGVVLTLQGCGSSPYVPVTDRSRSTAPQPAPASYVVQQGDTLYSIAFRYGLDFKTLARINRIGGSYQIYPGQTLKLRSGSARSSGSGSIVRDASIAQQTTATPSRTQTKRSEKKTTAQSTVKQPSATQKNSSPSAASGPIKWQWPASGEVIQNFTTSGKINKGINLAGKEGDPVHAAAAGRVVYAGNGLLGYGNLVIIDHNQQYLSAYAHNSKVMVKENDHVRAGQKIAEFGRTGTDRVMLHFEIRRDGQPLNPLNFLPKR
ncbi:peptidoglycan DD-metalloendopeptidase family protein [Neptuniibacter sp. CAU 1671]|uniref:peptidoglycan DD-metalloendopeptidase family protein n=1 Tax=Neptuniibacter sp. CAU 1671 TaxID=3032593 RepID=UPI0023DC11FE|nr:peptidoglycan DD-metalloendopeptidase family protein [Neptuniibacter sp. CAU 1671]MDF2181788.1 peptidoglycan DD-metalloendopeptidase family protein [Neptuniibacter sp. CAU 1671]